MNTSSERPTHWQGLESESQVPRYDTIKARIRGEKPVVLDVGCGSGVLGLHLGDAVDYHGIEPDEEAAGIAQQRHPGRVRHCTAESYQPEHSFDAIVFTEVLYYAADPVALLARYERFLAPSGRLIVSIYMRPEERSLLGFFRRCAHRILRPKTPFSNQHCAAMVDRYFSGRTSVSIDKVHLPGSPLYFRFWTAEAESPNRR